MAYFLPHLLFYFYPASRPPCPYISRQRKKEEQNQSGVFYLLKYGSFRFFQATIFQNKNLLNSQVFRQDVPILSSFLMVRTKTCPPFLICCFFFFLACIIFYQFSLHPLIFSYERIRRDKIHVDFFIS